MVLKRVEKQSTEDSAMKNGIFREYNTTAPEETSVLPLFNLKQKTAIVSGAGAGIGLQVAQGFAEAGANVAICRAYQTDITDYDDTKRVIDEIAEEFNGRLDIFVANAGIIWKDGGMIDGPVSDYRNVVSTDLDSVYYCAKAAGEIFRRQYETGVNMKGEKLENYRYGSFIATASMSGHIANIPQLQSAYNAAKAGVIHLCRSLAVEWVKFARVNSVSPGYIVTDISNFVPPETRAIWAWQDS
ncbi:hypothetical protein BTJ68_14463 [Hortaea werneckii EXF-2000]|uniref:Uncharacterized protein n=1 Tax=Hortaea werneckii EXF-2000 TaxID=1157616 RepID=A0A1Z5SRP1_HORWE|nr:hypothetical protein BTJ68_14463 [Hortaea werneckii EXF-2000]